MEQFLEVTSGMSEDTKSSLELLFSKETKIKDREKYTKRSLAKDQIMVEMATENMERVRNGIWNTAQLISLTQDINLKYIQDDINSLSFELAVIKLQNLDNPLITNDIKNNWIKKLQSHFYNT